MNKQTWEKRFKDAIELVGAPYTEQVNRFSSNFPVAEEIALNFNDEIFEQVDYLLEIKVINQLQYEKLHEISSMMSKMSENKKLDFWSLDALENTKEWKQLRLIANHIIELYS